MKRLGIVVSILVGLVIPTKIVVAICVALVLVKLVEDIEHTQNPILIACYCVVLVRIEDMYRFKSFAYIRRMYAAGR